MNPRRRNIFTLVALVVALTPAAVPAEVVRVEIATRQEVAGGKSFGNVGPYEKLIGKVYFAVDPNNPHNTIIVDLDKAPRNSQGKVEFSADLYILKPKDPTRGNGVLFFDVVNRGNKQLLGSFSQAPRSADPTTEADFGDGYLMREGYTLVAVGWQFDVPRGRGLVGFDAPIATDNGRPITGWVRMWFIPDKPTNTYEYVGGFNTPTYPPLDLNNAQYRLTEREGIFAPPRLIPRGDWQFGRLVEGKVVADPNSIWVKTGMKPGQTYELTYETKDPPVAGLGFASIRDLASALKYNRDAVAPGRYVYTYGASQTGRFQRQLIHEGFTIDEQGRKAIDGLFVHTGGSSLGSFNERFAQPNELGAFTETKFPIRYETTTDPVTGKRDGLGARIPAGLAPKIFLVDTSSEYWDRGRVAALRHTSIDGQQDLADAPNVRVYLLAGTQHGAGSFPPPETGGWHKGNSNNYRWAQRGLLAGLDKWVRQGVEPPANRHPLLADGTLVPQPDVKFPSIPGVRWPTGVPGGYRADLPGPYSALPFLLPQVDRDGNEIGGIRLPEQQVPLATLTGWSFRSERIGASNTLLAMIGSYIPMPATRGDREKNHDPRQSIADRYSNRADYLRRVDEAAKKLAQERYVLQEDVPALVDSAARHWDWVMAPAKSTQDGK